MATYRPKYLWQAPPAPLKFKPDWKRVVFYAGALALSLLVWGGIIVSCAKIVRVM